MNFLRHDFLAANSGRLQTCLLHVSSLMCRCFDHVRGFGWVRALGDGQLVKPQVGSIQHTRTQGFHVIPSEENGLQMNPQEMQ